MKTLNGMNREGTAMMEGKQDAKDLEKIYFFHDPANLFAERTFLFSLSLCTLFRDGKKNKVMGLKNERG